MPSLDQTGLDIAKIQKTIGSALQRGLTNGQLTALVERADILAQACTALAGGVCDLYEQTFEVEVEYDACLAELAERFMETEGKHTVYYSITEENFPPQNIGLGNLKKEILLFRPPCYMTNDCIFAIFLVLGLRPANLKELFALGIQYPKEQEKARIVALGSPCKRDGLKTEAPYLHVRAFEGHILALTYYDGWYASDRIAAVAI